MLTSINMQTCLLQECNFAKVLSDAMRKRQPHVVQQFLGCAGLPKQLDLVSLTPTQHVYPPTGFVRLSLSFLFHTLTDCLRYSLVLHLVVDINTEGQTSYPLIISPHHRPHRHHQLIIIAMISCQQLPQTLCLSRTVACQHGNASIRMAGQRLVVY